MDMITLNIISEPTILGSGSKYFPSNRSRPLNMHGRDSLRVGGEQVAFLFFGEETGFLGSPLRV
jgi:hypothetical protein